jgi:hypothetical protein
VFRPVAKGGRLGNTRLRAKSVCEIVKDYAERLGLKPADFGAHSLRAGFLTSAARRGASVFKMRDVSRHKSMDVLQAYVATPTCSEIMPERDCCEPFSCPNPAPARTPPLARTVLRPAAAIRRYLAGEAEGRILT